MMAVQTAENVYELRERKQIDVTPLANSLVPEIKPAATDHATVMPKITLEVSNGNGVGGMARKFSQLLSKQGYTAAKLTNQKPYQTKVTQIQYRDGYLAQAQLLQASLQGKSSLVQSNDIRADVSVRLVLGKNMVGHVALQGGEMPKLARNELGF